MTADRPCACTLLRKASRAVSRLYDEALAPAGMTTPQFAILRNLADDGTPLARLAEALVVDRTSLYRALAPLERQGWITISASPGGRARHASLTAAGRAAMVAAEPHWRDAQSRMADALGDEDWRAMEAAARRITTVAVEARP